jgi:hypothetical protein
MRTGASSPVLCTTSSSEPCSPTAMHTKQLQAMHYNKQQRY